MPSTNMPIANKFGNQSMAANAAIKNQAGGNLVAINVSGNREEKWIFVYHT